MNETPENDCDCILSNLFDDFEYERCLGGSKACEDIDIIRTKDTYKKTGSTSVIRRMHPDQIERDKEIIEEIVTVFEVQAAQA